MAGHVTGNRNGAICVFCGSSPGHAPGYLALARRLGTAMAKRGVGLVYGGGGVGLMGETARAVLDAGGDVIGVIPEFLTRLEVALETAPVEIVDNLHERKARMAALCDGYIILPGGIGTLEEVVEVMSWARLKLHQKPIIFLDEGGYYDGFFTFIEHAVKEGFMPEWAARQPQRTSDVNEAITLALPVNRASTITGLSAPKLV
jgi:uncharacterized protein (TIGR00730 family)